MAGQYIYSNWATLLTTLYRGLPAGGEPCYWLVRVDSMIWVGGATFFHSLDYRVMTSKTCPDDSLRVALISYFFFSSNRFLDHDVCGIGSKSERKELGGAVTAESVQLQPGWWHRLLLRPTSFINLNPFLLLLLSDHAANITILLRVLRVQREKRSMPSK